MTMLYQIPINWNIAPLIVTKKITIKRGLSLISKYHYLGGIGNSSMVYGTFLGSELVAVVCFSTPCSEILRSSILGSENKKHVIELSRLCLVPNCKIPATKIVSMAIQELQRERRKRGMIATHAIISFADSRQDHHGGIYQAGSWLYTGLSIRRNNYSFVDEKGVTRHPRQNGINISKEAARARGWRVIKPKKKNIKFRYVKIIGTKKQKKKFKRLLKLEVLPYPKPG